jgi:hypothetical protein
MHCSAKPDNCWLSKPSLAATVKSLARAAQLFSLSHSISSRTVNALQTTACGAGDGRGRENLPIRRAARLWLPLYPLHRAILQNGGVLIGRRGRSGDALNGL